ncbi:cardiolipin synthase [Clonorchis sinensis]|uniref:cardiolipin synthase (CMP-forming) n=2 Tax=Clonorchis sinensis TaxID=79923 RepID=A0A8T1M4K2_CLOSI|nr:cardiolipin synthase [Clonorchis sinensis]
MMIARRLGCLARTTPSSCTRIAFKRSLCVTAWCNQKPGSKRSLRVLTVPNAISACRIASTPVLAYLIMSHQLSYAVGLVVLTGLSDALDGYIARTWPSQQSLFGSYLDPVADKVMMTTLVLSMTASQLFPVNLTLLIIARDVGIVCAAGYLSLLSLPEPAKFSNLMQLRQIPLEMKASKLSKLNTTCQFTAVMCSLVAPLCQMGDSPLLHGVWLVAAGTTLASGLDYWRQLPEWRRRAMEWSKRASRQ